ncbi:nucleotide exchange factor GrpE [Azotosporobacter soli]|uniref:nucleotide exchange factor GrpE n=1 Tax=Azotosporobacter soli TaxID=3055040 RepID=UPI0031FE6B2E
MKQLTKKKMEEAKAMEETVDLVDEEQATVETKTVPGVEELTLEVAEKQRLLDEQVNHYKRLQADFENFRRRTRQEKEEMSAFVTQNLILDLLPVVDNFERAMAAAGNQDAANLLTGIEMIYRQLAQTLEKAGLTPVEAVGTAFDPQKHEAVMQVADDSQEAGIILEEFQKGYAVAGKVIRPSMVKVVG